MSPRMITELERIRYRKGQLLASRDLRDEQDFEALLRRMHNRYLHDTWGIAAGLEVKNVDSETVRVSPGNAYDAYGREIILATPVEIRLPTLNLNESSDLVVRYKENSEFPSRTALGSVCWAGENGQSGSLVFPAMLEQPVLLWRAPGTIRLGEEIPLARARRIELLANPALEYSVRRNAASLARPHVGYGSTLFSLSSVRLWMENQGTNTVTPVGFEIEIDTAAAGFASTPCYVFTSGFQIRRNKEAIRLPVPLFESIANARPNGFTYRFMLVASLIPPVLLEVQALETITIGVQWLGIEHGGAGQPYDMEDGGTR